MKSYRSWLFALGLCSALTACSASGFLGLETVVKGPITVVDPTSGAVFTTGKSANDPYLASGGGFSIGITEDHYSGPYTITQTAFSTLGTQYNYSCFDPHIVDNNDKINVVRFQIDGGATISPTPNPMTGVTPPAVTPCGSGETETYLIADTKGHQVYFYLEIP